MSEGPAKYVEHVMSLFGRRSPGRARAETGAEAGQTGGSPAVEPRQTGSMEMSQDQAAFEARLRQLAARTSPHGGLVAGRIHMLNVDKVRERLGERWPRFAERVHSVIKSELKVRLTQHDLFTQVGPDSYVIVFGDCSELEARLKVALLSEQILEKLLGEAEANDVEALGVQRFVTQADGTVAGEALGSTAALMDVLDQAGARGVEPQTYDIADAAAGRRALSIGEVAHLMGNVGSQLDRIEGGPPERSGPIVKIDQLRRLLRQLEAVEAAMAGKAPAFGPTREREGARATPAAADHMKGTWELIRDVRARAERQVVFHYDQDPTAGGGLSKPEISLQVDFAYFPMWHVPTKRVGIYACKPTVLRQDGKVMDVHEQDPDREADILAIVDRLTLRRVRDDLKKAMARREPNVVMVPVHFATLSRQGSRTSFVELCSNIPNELRNVLAWEILGSHVDSWSLQLDGVLAKLRPFGRGVFLRIDGAQDNFPQVRRNFPYLSGKGITAVGLDVAGMRGTEAERLKVLDQVSELASQNRLGYYGHGLASLSLTICAVCMGYQHVSGPAIAEATSEPLGIHPTAMEHIYGRAIFGSALAGTG